MTAVAVGPRDGELLRSLHDEHAAALWHYVTGLLNAFPLAFWNVDKN